MQNRHTAEGPARHNWDVWISSGCTVYRSEAVGDVVDLAATTRVRCSGFPLNMPPIAGGSSATARHSPLPCSSWVALRSCRARHQIHDNRPHTKIVAPINGSIAARKSQWLFTLSVSGLGLGARGRPGAHLAFAMPMELPERRCASGHSHMASASFPKLHCDLAGSVARDLEGVVDALCLEVDTARWATRIALQDQMKRRHVSSVSAASALSGSRLP